MNVLSKTNIQIHNKWISRFLRVIPQPIALSILNYEKKRLAARGVINHKESFTKNTDRDTIRLVFILYKPQLWNSQRSVYEAAVRNPNVEVSVVVTPDENILSDGRVLDSYDYYKEKCPEAIEAVKDGVVFDISSIKPDIIIRQSPYDSVFPLEYSMERLARIAKTCYIPYNYNYTPNHLHIEYNSDLLSDLYAVFSDCNTNYEYCVKERDKWYPDLHPYFLGFPRLDIVRRMGGETRNGKVFMWIPRWNTDKKNNDGTSFFDYKDKLLDFFCEHPDLKLIIRPHPVMFSTFVRIGLMTQKDVELYLERVRKCPNVFMDDNMDYLQTFENTDVLIADMSSINYEFYLTGKPIIFCGDPNHYNEETKTMYELLYMAPEWDKLKEYICSLSEGGDYLYESRKEDICKAYSGLPDDIGEAIVMKCIKIARGNSDAD